MATPEKKSAPAIEETKQSHEKKCYLLRVKRKKAETPADTLVLESIELPNNKKRLRVLPPEDYIEARFDKLVIAETKSTPQPKQMVFQLVQEIGAEAKNAEEVKVDIDGNECSLFKVCEKAALSFKADRINILERYGKVEINQKQKETALEEDAKARKQKRSELINKKRGATLAKLHEGIFICNSRVEEVKEKIAELKEKEEQHRTDLLYCNEKPLTIEYWLYENI